MILTLKRLEMHGFKSFAKRSVLEFNAPVTAIVGPNGSGKSNVVEAIRFVLGEQSSKSLRSKSGADLIFKGSRLVPKMNRAFVAMVFDNTKRMFQLPTLSGTLSLDFDEISIGREVFADGTNEYTINGSSVRLKDIHELIASVHIGSSGHHIISQGEADRLLNAKPVERREILEEALGLRLYHYRITDTTKKLEKTREHMKEVELLRRELAPHIKFLKKQVERVEQAEGMRKELADLYRIYLVTEEGIVTTEMNRLNSEMRVLQEKRVAVIDVLQRLEKSDDTHIHHLQQRLSEFHQKRKQLELQDSEITRSLGRIEGTLQAIDRVMPKVQHSTTLDTQVVSTVTKEAREIITQIYETVDPEEVKKLIRAIDEKIQSLEKILSGSDAENKISDQESEKQTLLLQQKQLELESQKIQNEITVISSEVVAIEQSISEAQSLLRQADQERFNQESLLRDIDHRLQLVGRDNESMAFRYSTLDAEYRIAEGLLGDEIRGIQGTGSHDPEMSTVEHESRKIMIDKLKIRLEDMGGGGAGDIMHEYNETVERDRYLEQQLHDLDTSIRDLESIISDLKQSLTIEFQKGVKQINSVFETFFVTMFGGGSAKLHIIDIIPKKRKTDSLENDQEEYVDEDAPKEMGVEIDVNLPRKKVKDLEMLSGGERSLTSIALLFALSQVNPPPFLVLDETDAALDEANSKKYGDMIERLAQETQLIVVTHNRETMSRASILYGVTLGSDDASTLLSINFTEAVKVAK